MDKKIAALLGAMGALTTVTAAQAAISAQAPTPRRQAASYRDLLEAVPNPVAALKADDARLAQDQPRSGLQLAQYYHHHHHHHHHHFFPRPFRRFYHHHHHHHHHHHVFIIR